MSNSEAISAAVAYVASPLHTLSATNLAEEIQESLRCCAVAIDGAVTAVESNAAAAHELIDQLAGEARKILTASCPEVADADSRMAYAERSVVEFHSQIAAAEARKRVALEGEAVRVDEALALACEVVGGPSDVVQRMRKAVSCLPGRPVEPTEIRVLTASGSEPASLSHITAEDPLPFRISALSLPTTADVLLSAPASVRPAPRQVLCRLTVTPAVAGLMHPSDEDAVVQQLAAHIKVVAVLVPPTASDISASLGSAAGSGRAHIVPTRAEVSRGHCSFLELVVDLVGMPVDACVVVTELRIAGRPFTTSDVSPDGDSCIPLAVRVRRYATPLHAPNTFAVPSANTYKALSISDDGELYAAVGGAGVDVFGPDGSKLRRLEVTGLSAMSGVACVPGNDVIILSEHSGSPAARTAAVNARTGDVLWVVGPICGCDLSANGIAVMPQQGLVVVSSPRSLVALRVSDGTQVAVERHGGWIQRVS